MPDVSPQLLTAIESLAKSAAAGQSPDVLAVLTAAGWRAPAATQDEVAEYFGVVQKAVQYWVKNGAPRIANGSRHLYDLAELGRWLYRRTAQGDETIGEAKRRKTEAEAQLTELKVEKETGAVITVVEHEQRVSAVLQLLRDQLRHFADAAAEDFADPDAAAKLDRRTADMFAQLAKVAEPNP